MSTAEFTSVDGLWQTVLRHLLYYGKPTGSRDGQAVEVVGYQACLDMSQQRTLLVNPKRRLCPRYAAAELLWYLSGRGETEMLQRYAPSYKKFTEEDGCAYGAYGPRAMPQIPDIIKAMHNAGETRQAVVAIWRPDDLKQAVVPNTKKDLPCTLHWQFLAREGELHMVVSMRSNDAWLGLPYDVFCFTAIQRLLACELQLRPGKYVHQVGSMHLYGRNIEAARSAMREHDFSRGHHWRADDGLGDNVRWAIRAEESIRAGFSYTESGEIGPGGHMLHDLLRACAGTPCESPDFRRLQEQRERECAT